MTETSTYTYDPKYQVIAVSGDIDNPCTNCTQYFKIFSAAYTVSICSGFPDMDMRRLDQLYNLTGSLDNQSFSIIQLGEYSTTTGEYKVYEMNDWLNIYHPLTVGLANQINSFIRNKINQIKNSQDFASTFLIMENKVDLIISKGKENVNAALKDKVDYNYDSLITKWKQINNDKSTLENYINNSSINYTIADLSQSKVFKDLMQNKLLSKQLKTEIAQFNQSLDGEVLPLLQSN